MATKLVRDKIPKVIENATGKSVIYKIAPPSKMPVFLRKKLDEEIKELDIAIKNKDKISIIDELADVAEVLEAIGRQNNIPASNVSKKKKVKLHDRGGFKKRIVMDF